MQEQNHYGACHRTEIRTLSIGKQIEECETPTLYTLGRRFVEERIIYTK